MISLLGSILKINKWLYNNVQGAVEHVVSTQNKVDQGTTSERGEV